MKEYACCECGLVFPIDRFYYVGTYRRKQCKTCFDAAKEDRKQAKRRGEIKPGGHPAGEAATAKIRPSVEPLSDRDWNRLHMPETARLMAQAREELAELGPLRFIGASENGWEVGTQIETVGTGTIDIDGTFVTVERVKFRHIGARAKQRE